MSENIRVTAELRIYRERLERAFQHLAARKVDDLTGQIARDARRIAPRDTGRLASKIRTEPARPIGLFTVRGEVAAAGPVARWMHEGTRPHVIRPRNARALRFRRVIFASHVNHPGTAPNPFLEMAARRVAGQVNARRSPFTDR